MRDDAYYDRIFHALEHILQQVGLSWIFREVAAQVLLGQVTIQTSEEKKKLPRGETSGTYSTDYTPKERLELLLDAIKHMIVNTAEMENEILTFYLSQNDTLRSRNGPEAVHFSSEIDSEDITVIDWQQTPLRQHHARIVGNAINKIQEIINDDN